MTQGVCAGCARLWEGWLRAVAWLMPELETTASRQYRFGSGVGPSLPVGMVVPLPVNLHATDCARDLVRVLRECVAEVWTARGPRHWECPSCGASPGDGARVHTVAGCGGRWMRVGEPLRLPPTAEGAAAWLLAHAEWVHGSPQVARWHRGVGDAVDAAVRAVDRPRERVALGACAAVVERAGVSVKCQGEVWAVEDERMARCRVCGFTHDVEGRRRAQVAVAREAFVAQRDRLLTVKAMTRALGLVGVSVTESVLWNLRARGRLVAKVVGVDGYVRLRRDEDGGPVEFRVGDVMDALAARPGRGGRAAGVRS